MANGSDVNIRNNQGSTALHYATAGNLPEVVALLLKHEADVSHIKEDIIGRLVDNIAQNGQHEGAADLYMACKDGTFNTKKKAAVGDENGSFPLKKKQA